jgi:long-chain acyl-CoA synthetase
VPERTALVCEGTRLSYAELQAATNQVANGLVQAGISKGNKVALSCQDVPSFVIAYYGILKAGAVVLPLNILLKTREIAYHLTDGDAKAYFCQEGTPELPTGQLGYAAFLEVESCQHFFLMTNEFGAPSSIPGATTLSMLMAISPSSTV